MKIRWFYSPGSGSGYDQSGSTSLVRPIENNYSFNKGQSFLHAEKKILSRPNWKTYCLDEMCSLLRSLIGCALVGAAVMMACRNGVQAKLKDLVPHAVSTHCHAHNLSLVVMGK